MDAEIQSIMNKQRIDKIAVYKVSARLLSSRIITARPDVDINGADLLAILKVQDGAKFARIQCKGRTLGSPKSNTKIEIRKSYATGTFTLLLYLYCSYDSTDHLLCFFAHDIRTRNDLWRPNDNKYRLTLSASNFRQRFDLFYFNESKIKALREKVQASDMGKEFYYVFGKGNFVLTKAKFEGRGH
jgi:hypothetical protein